MKIPFLMLIAFILISCQKKENIEVEKPSLQNIDSDSLVLKGETHQIEKQILRTDPLTKIHYNKYTKGIYLTAYTIATQNISSVLDSAEAAGINTIVFDLKNMNGNIFFRMPQKGFLKADNIKPIVDTKKTVTSIHKRNMRAVARLVMFHDQITAQRDSTLRPQNIQGGSWQESKRKKPSWLDPSNKKVQDTLFEIIKEVCQFGIDEIQLDYVRFPTQGDISNAVFAFQREDSLFINSDSTYICRDKPEIIETFVQKVKSICNESEVTLTADVFAIVSWQREVDINATGQDISRMSKNLDAIHPMIYSSHFARDFGYREDLPNEPYYIVYKGSKLTLQYTNSDCKVIPYIQSNSWKVNYTYDYIIAQIEAVVASGADGYILWNASNNYYRTLRWIREFDNNK
ncbi:MAG: putative glycoside hydrolase [Candidatus Cloacimonetes bacterium]|nr:putative glycoside hydrolase [Candidatus Cloacimonadota bacterium]